jgi:hypothetical protein
MFVAQKKQKKHSKAIKETEANMAKYAETGWTRSASLTFFSAFTFSKSKMKPRSRLFSMMTQKKSSLCAWKNY